MKKKILLIVITTIAVLATLCVASTFLLGYCPVIGRMIANAKLSEQSGEKMLSFYDILNNVYAACDSNGRQFYYSLQNNTFSDPEYCDDIERQAEKKYSEFLKKLPNDETIIYPESILASTVIDASDKSKTYTKLYVMVIYDDNSLDFESVKDRICRIANAIIECTETNCTSIQLIYANKSGMFELSSNSSKKTLSYERMSKNITQFDEDDLPMDYIEWRKTGVLPQYN